MCNVNPGVVNARYMESVLASFMASRQLGLEIGYMHAHGIYIPQLRERLARSFLDDEDHDYMLCVDSDVIWSPADLGALVDAGENGCDIVGGLGYNSWPEGVKPMAWTTEPPGNHVEQDVIEQARDNDEALIEVGSIATAMLLVRRSVVAALVEAHGRVFDLEDETGVGGFTGEDVLFCRRARALGFKVWLHADVRLRHEKTVTLGG
jgi:GT2 family glycosyltransferase